MLEKIISKLSKNFEVIKVDLPVGEEYSVKSLKFNSLDADLFIEELLNYTKATKETKFWIYELGEVNMIDNKFYYLRIDWR